MKVNEYDDIADLLMKWNVHDGRLGQFDRGLHILAHLSRGGTLEEYGQPPTIWENPKKRGWERE